MTGTTPTLGALTTTGVGGPADRLVVAASQAEIIDAVQDADAAGRPLLIVGGGSNLVVADEGFAGTVLKIATTGYTVNDDDATCGGVMVKAEAGQPWDELVEQTVRHAWSGLEALSGIPGLTGATPVQNVGAYGADVSATIAAVRTWDRVTRAVRTFTSAELGFGYRDSILKRTTRNGSPSYVVLDVQFQLALGRMSAPVRYADLAAALGIAVGERAYANDVRREVLRLRRSKGMVLDAPDRDTWSTGSFFTNPIVPLETAETLPADAPRYPVSTEEGGMVKLSAAWLIDRAGFNKGFGLEGTQAPSGDGGVIRGTDVAGGRAALSTKHTLAVTNRGGAAASDILAVARAVRDGVERTFGIRLHPEPLLIGCSL